MKYVHQRISARMGTHMVRQFEPEEEVFQRRPKSLSFLVDIERIHDATYDSEERGHFGAIFGPIRDAISDGIPVSITLLQPFGVVKLPELRSFGTTDRALIAEHLDQAYCCWEIAREFENASLIELSKPRAFFLSQALEDAAGATVLAADAKIMHVITKLPPSRRLWIHQV